MSYLCYFDSQRVLTVRRVKNWLQLSSVIKRCLKGAGVSSAPNPHRRLPWILVEPAERLMWILPYLLGIGLIGAIFFMTNPDMQSALACIISPGGDVCRDWMSAQIERAIQRVH